MTMTINYQRKISGLGTMAGAQGCTREVPLPLCRSSYFGFTANKPGLLMFADERGVKLTFYHVTLNLIEAR